MTTFTDSIIVKTDIVLGLLCDLNDGIVDVSRMLDRIKHVLELPRDIDVRRVDLSIDTEEGTITYTIRTHGWQYHEYDLNSCIAQITKIKGLSWKLNNILLGATAIE